MLKIRDHRLDPTLAVAGSGLVLSLGFTGAMLLGQGHAAYNTRSNGVIWGLPIVSYEFLVAVSTGLALLALTTLVLDLKAFRPVVKRGLFLSIVCLLAGLAVLGLELGHPIRMLWAVPSSLQVVSPMWWKGVLYPVYLLLQIGLFVQLHLGRDGPLRRGLGLAALLLAIAALTSSALVYGMMAMRPFWFDGLLPAYFLAKDLLAGVAVLVPALWLAYGLRSARMPERTRNLVADPLPRLLAALLAIALLLAASRTLTGLWSHQDGLQVFDLMVGSPWFHAGLWAGMVLPLVMLLVPGLRARPGVQVTAALLVLGGQFIGHYEFVVYGQIVPLFKGTWVHGFIQYAPSAAEWALALLALFMVLLLYRLGARWLRLAD